MQIDPLGKEVGPITDASWESEKLFQELAEKNQIVAVTNNLESLESLRADLIKAGYKDA
jgi:hypothetical protein